MAHTRKICPSATRGRGTPTHNQKTMKKIRLEVDALRVESFETAEEERPRGTVVANNASNDESCRESFCLGDCSMYDGCSNNPTCVYSCQTGPCWCVLQP